jgi:uncharacterized Tic20 family protein
MNKIITTTIGVVLALVAIYIAIFVEGRGDMMVIFFALFGGFMISSSLVTKFVKDVWGAIKGRNGG